MFAGAFAEVRRCSRRRGGVERRGAEARRPKRGIASAERSGAREARTPGCCEPRSSERSCAPLLPKRRATTNAATPRPHAQPKPVQASVGGRRRPRGKCISRSGSGEASFLLAAPRGDFRQRLFSTSGGFSDLPAVRVPCRATTRVLMHEAVDLPGSLRDPVPLSGRSGGRRAKDRGRDIERARRLGHRALWERPQAAARADPRQDQRSAARVPGHVVAGIRRRATVSLAKGWWNDALCDLVHGEKVRRASQRRGCVAAYVPPHGGHTLGARPQRRPGNSSDVPGPTVVWIRLHTILAAKRRG